MSRITVKREKLAVRCEICHQMDKFNPKKNYCKRCYKFNPNRDNQAIVSTNFINGLSNVLFFGWKMFLFITIPSFVSSVLALGAIFLLFITLCIVGIMLNLLGLPINEFIGSIIQTSVFLLVIIAAICGFAIGIKMTFTLFGKPLNTNSNGNLDISDLENQPYYADSKNIYS